MSLNKKLIDVATLGSLCVDIVLKVPELPQSSPQQRKAFLHQFSNTPPPKVNIVNFMSILIYFLIFRFVFIMFFVGFRKYPLLFI